MSRAAGDGHALGLRYFPEPDALTVEEYHRRMAAPATAAPPQRPTVVCVACDQPFVPHKMAGPGRQRFCNRACRVWYHYGPGRHARKTTAA